MQKDFISIEDLLPIYQGLGSNELILDVRTDEEYHLGRVPGSDHISHDRVTERADDFRKFDKVYIYCRRGARAQFAYSMLRSCGLDNLICVADGGWERWERAGFPREND